MLIRENRELMVLIYITDGLVVYMLYGLSTKTPLTPTICIQYFTTSFPDGSTVTALEVLSGTLEFLDFKKVFMKKKSCPY